MLQVFHNDRFLKYHLDHGSLINTTVRRVAFVDTTDDPQEAYRLTNNFDRSWTLHNIVHGVRPCCDVQQRAAGLRSTSVGDLIVAGSAGDPGSKHYVVEPLGFRELTRKEICSITYHIQ